MEQISKKELLEKTGISYGQLYRWKRQKLIPEEWFLKQSSYTGQETFFPKKLILDRISAILQKKDQYSLDELAELFSPEYTELEITVEQVQEMKLLDTQLTAEIIHTIGQTSFSMISLVLLTAAADAASVCTLSPEHRQNLYTRALSCLPCRTGRFLVFSAGGIYYCAVTDGTLIFDRTIHVIYECDLGRQTAKVKEAYYRICGSEKE